MFLDITEYLKIFDLETEDNLENLSIVYDLLEIISTYILMHYRYNKN